MIQLMTQIDEKIKCCGCTACSSGCPVDAILMVPDSEGFAYPRVDADKCVNCGKCDNICPINNPVKLSENCETKGYVAMNKNQELRLKSSSGGIFTLLAEVILNQNGVVYGATFDGFKKVRHLRSTSKDELSRMRGSKYIQSDLDSIFDQVKNDLNNGILVLFSGTGCQVAGLKKYLGKDYDNLYTVDVLCHGVPSAKVWSKYLDEISKERKIQNVVFRHKSSGWKNYSLRIDFEDESFYQNRFRHDAFMKLFLSDICLRPSCHDCKYKEVNRPSDITIGDAWGVDDYLPEMDDDKGTSVVLVRGNKGEKLFDAIRDNLKYMDASTEKILPPWSNARKSVPKHPKREIFWERMEKQNASIYRLSKMVQDSIFKRAYFKWKNIVKKLKK